MKRWEDHYNSREGETAVIFGKGPSLDAWINAGRPKMGFHIGINQAGVVADCEYNISRHYRKDFSKAEGEWFMPLIHNWEYAEKYAKCSFVRPIFPAHWFIPVGPTFFRPTREDMRDFRTFYTDGGSCNCAVELAYYLGAKRVIFVGVDGGTGYASAMDGIVECTTPSHSLLRSQSDMASERRFPGNFSHWSNQKTTLDAFTSEPSFVVVCRSGGDYDMSHANCLRRQFYAHNKNQDFKFYCITDTPTEDWHVPMQTDLPGWWAVLEAWRFTGPTIIVGLDTLICDDLSPFTKLALECPQNAIYGIHDFLRPKWSDGVSIWNGDHRNLTKNFCYPIHSIKPADHKTVWGVMDYNAASMVENGIDRRYMDDEIAGIKAHYVSPSHPLHATSRDGTRIVCWASHPRPWQCNSWAGEEYRSYMK